MVCPGPSIAPVSVLDLSESEIALMRYIRSLGLGRDTSVHQWRQTFVGELLEDNQKYRLHASQALQRDASYFRTKDFMSVTREDFDDIAHMTSQLQGQASEVCRITSVTSRVHGLNLYHEATLHLSSPDSGKHVPTAGSPRSRGVRRSGFPVRVGKKGNSSPSSLLGSQPLPPYSCTA